MRQESFDAPAATVLLECLQRTADQQIALLEVAPLQCLAEVYSLEGLADLLSVDVAAVARQTLGVREAASVADQFREQARRLQIAREDVMARTGIDRQAFCINLAQDLAQRSPVLRGDHTEPDFELEQQVMFHDQPPSPRLVEATVVGPRLATMIGLMTLDLGIVYVDVELVHSTSANSPYYCPLCRRVNESVS